MPVIVVERRPDDIMAYLKDNDNKAIWGRGRSVREAIGDLILVQPEAFGLEVEKNTESFERWKLPLQT